jgi:site-specific DNA-methyltransferase (adenine-specific)/site-specific DNA-methyltransferase (cytosine-N4-specific)
VVPGQVWKLGEHRLICGDAADPGAWERLAAQREGGVEGIFTSPPYAQQRKGSYGGIAEADYLHWFEPAQANARTHLAAGGSFFLNIKAHSADGRRSLYVLDLVLAMARRWGWSFIDEFCWTRQGLPGRWPNRFKNAFEPIFHFARSPDIRFFPEAVIRPFSPATIIGSRHYVGRNTDHSYHISNNVTAAGLDGALPSNVLTIPTGQTAETIGAYHGAAFPPALAEFFIKAFSQPGDTWCDPFLGSGTTLIACETLGRRCVGIEIRPEYVAVALARWQHKTGRLPRLIAN